MCWIEKEMRSGGFVYDVHDGMRWPLLFLFIRPDAVLNVRFLLSFDGKQSK